jgi:Lipase (class 3)
MKDDAESDSFTLLNKSFDGDRKAEISRKVSDFEQPGDDEKFEELTIGFSNRDDAVSLSHHYTGFTRLEVMHGRDIDNLVLIFNTITFIGLLYALIVMTLSRTTFSQELEPVPDIIPPGLRSYNPRPGYVAVESIASIVGFFYSFLLLILYTRRILTTPVAVRTAEQSLLILQLAGIAIYLNPYEAIIRLKRDVIGSFEPEIYGWFSVTTQIADGLSMVSFTTLSMLYVWTIIHSYSVLSGDMGKRPRMRVILPKAGLISIIVVYKVVFFVGLHGRRGLYFSELPLMSFVGMLSLYSRVGTWPSDEVAINTALFIYEMSLVIWIAHDFFKTKSLLAESDYVKHRTKQVGFRFFIYLNALFYSTYITIYLIQLLSMPQGPQIVGFLVGGMADYGVQYIPFGMSLILLGYATIQAHASLPADALGLGGWFGPNPRQNSSSELEPILYRSKDPPSMPSTLSSISANCFTMQTHVDLFNIAWYAYYHGTSKQTKLNIDFSRSSMKVSSYIKAKETDTHCVVFECSDRIMICFKGTSSTKNMSTDLKMKQSSVLSAMPTSTRAHASKTSEFPDSQNDHGQSLPAQPEPRSFMKQYSPTSIRAKVVTDNAGGLIDFNILKKAKIHSGFAIAYRSVAKELVETVSALLSSTRRPIYISGHSLGGALATLCSLDLALCVGVERNQMLVSTFGSPKVGNESFRQLYNKVVPINWRIVAGGDMISRLPKAGYSHVGKKVLLTPDGELFIDPDSLEVKLWHAMPASLAYHRKSSYLLSMRAWCYRYHGKTFVPNFWSFPISADDSERFEHIVSVKFRTGMPHSAIGPTSSRRKGLPRVERIQLWSDLVDQLQGPDHGASQSKIQHTDTHALHDGQHTETLRLWAQLVQPVLHFLRSYKSNLPNRDKKLVGSDAIYDEEFDDFVPSVQG